MKVRVINRPTGCIDGKAWPKKGETINLPDVVAEGMIAAGSVERVAPEPKVEKRPAPTKGTETRSSKPKDD